MTANTPTHQPAEPASIPSTMRAFIQDRYGPAEILHLREIETPRPGEGQVLIRVKAASLNIYDWHMTTGTPYMVRMMAGFTKPKNPVAGADVAGIVVEVGQGVSAFAVGDEVFGEVGGSFAEYARASERALVHKPANVTFQQAAAAPMAALTALQGLRDHGRLQAGQKVVVNGASGGVGTMAVQIAKALGAEVTAVCSTTKVDTARELGADRVIDYTKDDYTELVREQHILFDNAGDRPWSETSRVLTDEGIMVTITGPKHSLFGPLRNLAFRKLQSRRGGRDFTWFTAQVKREDLEYLGGLLQSGTLQPVIEKEYPLEQVPDALRYLGEGHARGKLVITV